MREELSGSVARPPRITVAIPTFRRPERLRGAIASVRAQCGLAAHEYGILIIDNAPEESACAIAKSFPAGGAPIRYVHEAQCGPAHARNRAVQEAHAEFIAFLDDDETASPGWLAALLHAINANEADAAFGPVIARFDFPPQRHVDFVRRLYSRTFHAEPGVDIGRHYAHLGTGNSIFRVATCFAGPEPFPVEVASTGGEDTVFLRRLALTKRRFVWAAEASVEEHVPADRTQPEFLRARRFRQGQLRTLACLTGSLRGKIEAGFWMAAGIAQYAIAACGRVVFQAAGKLERAEQAGFQMAGGLGKFAWWAPSPSQYGATPNHGKVATIGVKIQNFS